MSDPARYPEFDDDAQDLNTPDPTAEQEHSSFPAVDYGATDQAPIAARAEDEDLEEDDEDLDDQADDEPVDEESAVDEDDEAVPHSKAASRITAGLGMAARGASAAGKLGYSLARRYPRAGLAAGLSAAILGGVLVLRPGSSPHDLPNRLPPPEAPPVASQTEKPDEKPEPTPPTPPVAAAETEKPQPGPSAPSAPPEKPNSGPETEDVAENDLPALPVGQDNPPAPAPGPDASASPAAGLLTTNEAAKGAEAAAAPAPLPAPEPAADGLKLTGGEKPDPAALDPIEAANPGDSDLAAPPLPPIGELALADAKPGTPPAPGPGEAPAPAPAPGLDPAALPAPEASAAEGPKPEPSKATPGDQAPTSSALPAAAAATGAVAGAVIGSAVDNAPAPTPAPTPSALLDSPSASPGPSALPAPAPPETLPAPADAKPAPPDAKPALADPKLEAHKDGGPLPGPDPKLLAGAASTAAKGATAKAAVVAGGVGLGLGAAVSALTHGDKDPDKDKPADNAGPGEKDKPPPTDQPPPAARADEAQPAPLVPGADPAPAPSPAEPALGPADPGPAVPRPGDEKPGGTSAPAPEHSPAPSVAKPASAPAQAPHAVAPAAAAAAGLATGAALPALHPVGEPSPAASQPTPSPEPAHAAPAAEVKPRDSLESQGWVPIEHAGSDVVRDVQRDIDGAGDEPRGGNATPSAVDLETPAEKEPSFDVESPPIAIKGPDADQASGRRGGSSDEGKLETVLHKVEPNENFWTISRMYYSSGRYYKALWKANADRVPKIDELHVDSVIRVPPPEDLDPRYIDPPGTRASRPKAMAAADRDTPIESRDAVVAASNPAPRRASKGDGVPIRRSSRPDDGLTLPVDDAGDPEVASTRPRSSRAREIDFRDDSESPARSRSAVTRPIYKVRPYDTLRSIARDTMGDSHRADEILDLNRDLIDDPSRLIVGQILELPEDARPSRARSRR